MEVWSLDLVVVNVVNGVLTNRNNYWASFLELITVPKLWASDWLLITIVDR